MVRNISNVVVKKLTYVSFYVIIKLGDGMKRNIILTIVILLVLFLCFKTFILIRNHAERRDLDTKMIFNETLTVNIKDYDGEYISADEMSIANYFDEYVDVNEYFKAKYEDDTVVAFYSLSSAEQYINMLDMKNFELATDDKTISYVPTSNSVKKYLNKHNIKDDIDLLNYIKNNYYFKSNLFTSIKNIKMNYLLNTFVDSTLPNIVGITLIAGDVEGYIYNVSAVKNLLERFIY